MSIRNLGITLSLLLVLSCAFAGTALAAEQTLMDRVNEALREAGLPVTPETQQSFAAGVASGHYKTFEQLVNAMKWHKAQGKWVAQVKHPVKTWVFKGTVTEVNKQRLEVTGTKNGVEMMPKFRITKNTKVVNGVLLFDVPEQVHMEVKNEIRRGSVVKVWATASNEALVIENLAPAGQGDYYGPVDCPSCQGSNNFIADTPAAPQEEEEECSWEW